MKAKKVESHIYTIDNLTSPENREQTVLDTLETLEVKKTDPIFVMFMYYIDYDSFL